MKVSFKVLVKSLKEDDIDKLNYVGKKYEDFNFIEDNNNLLLIIFRYIFFFNGHFSYQELNNKKNESKWFKKLLNSFYDYCLKGEDTNFLYVYFNSVFSLNYNNIKKDYGNFITNILQMNGKNNCDLCSYLIALLSFVNGNKKYTKTFFDIQRNDIIIKHKNKYDKMRVIFFWEDLTYYFLLIKVPIIYKDINGTDNKKFTYDMKELKCYVELCHINNSIKIFIETIYRCIIDCKDIRENKPKDIQKFIGEIFNILNIYLKNSETWDEAILYSAYDKIYELAFQYTSENFDKNYIDFIIQYIKKYKLGNEDFFNLFFNGLITGNTIKTFIYLKLNEEIIDITDEKIIKELINKMIKKKRKKNKIKEEIKIEKLSENSTKINEEKANLTISENNAKIQNDESQNNNDSKKIITNDSINDLLVKKLMTEIKELKNEISSLKINYESQINELKEKNEELEEENSILTQELNKNAIMIDKYVQQIKKMKKTLDISFRDLSKKMLDNMLNYVNKEENSLFKFTIGRKKKLAILQERYEYKNIYYMKKPISEIKDKYYNANKKSHVPNIVNIIRDGPFGLMGDPSEEIALKYYNIIINSKNNDVFDFIKNKLNIIEEIKKLYIDI